MTLSFPLAMLRHNRGGKRDKGMELRQLRYFLAIFEQGSLMKAADVLHVAQPALSANLRKLEEELGVPLFERRSTGVIATPEGREMARHVRSILRSVEEARESVRQRAEETVGAVVLAVPTSLTSVLAVPLIERVQTSLPNVRLRVVETMTGYIPDWILGDKVDLGLLYNKSDSLGLESTRLLTEELYLAVPSQADLEGIAEDGEVAFEALAEMEFVLPGAEHGLRRVVDAAARRSGIRLRVRTEIDALPQIKTLVRRRRGFTILSLAALHEDQGDERLVTARIVSPTIERSVYLTRSATRPLTRAAREVERQVTRLLQESARQKWWMARV